MVLQNAPIWQPYFFMMFVLSISREFNRNFVKTTAPIETANLRK